MENQLFLGAPRLHFRILGPLGRVLGASWGILGASREQSEDKPTKRHRFSVQKLFLELQKSLKIYCENNTFFAFKRFYRKTRFGIDFPMDFEPFWLSFSRLGASWGRLGRAWTRLGRAWRRLGTILERLGAAGGCPRASWADGLAAGMVAWADGLAAGMVARWSGTPFEKIGG